MAGSTLYRRLPDGSWAAEREDGTAAASADEGKVPWGIAGAAAAAAAGSAAAPEPTPEPTPQPRPDQVDEQPPDHVDEEPAASAAAVEAGASPTPQTPAAAAVVGGAAAGAALGAAGAASAASAASPSTPAASESSAASEAPAAPAGSPAPRSAPSAQAAASAAPAQEPAHAPAPAYSTSVQAPVPAAPAGSPPAPGKPPRGPVRTWLRRIALVVAIAITAYVVWIAGLLIYAAASLHQIEALSPQPIPDTEGQVWLLVGSDSREGLTAEQQKELHTGGVGGQRTDTIMLAFMRPGEEPQLISLPRDSWVTIPAHTASNGTEVGAAQDKINAAFAYGGAPLLSETVEYNTGLYIDHYLEISMYGVVALTDAVGGIEVCFDEAIKDEKSGLDVEAGCQVLNGEEALAWVRMRYSDPKGDLGRIERQQEFVKLIMQEILSWETLLQPWRQLDIVNAVLDSVLVDLETGAIDLGRFGLGVGRIVAGSGEVGTVPLVPGNHTAGGQSVVLWDTAEAEELFASMGGSPPQASD